MALADDIGARTAPHQIAPIDRAIVRRLVTQPSTAAAAAAAPSMRNTRRGSQVGNASGAKAAWARRTYALTRPDAPLTPTSLNRKSTGNTMSPSATAAIGIATMAR